MISTKSAQGKYFETTFTAVRHAKIFQYLYKLNETPLRITKSLLSIIRIKII